MKNVPYGRQEITQEDVDSVVRILRSDFLTQGPAVAEFENSFSNAVGASFSIAVSNGTAALHLAVLALDLKPGDRVLCTANSFVASSNCIRYVGGDVEFVDIDAENFCIDIKALSEKLTNSLPGTFKGIVAVDFAGFPIVGKELRELADQHGLWIIEDACHALGGQRFGSKVGACEFSDISTFSFHPVKHITTGEGGMITTRSEKLYKKLNLLRTHGITKNPLEMTHMDGPWYYEMQELGFNYRLPDILCALGVSQLRRLSTNIERRQKIANVYRAELPSESLKWTQPEQGITHGYHLFVVETPQRDELYLHLKREGVHCQVHYIPIHTHPYYKNLYGSQRFPNAEKFYSQALSLPMYQALTENDQSHVIEAVKKFFE